MTKITEYIKQSRKCSKLIREYFRLLPPESSSYMFRLVHSRNFSLKEREKNYKNLKLLIGQLEKNFKKRVVENNKNANFLGYPNYLEYILTSDIIPKESFSLFLKNIDRFVALVHKDFPSTELVKKVKKWTMLNIPFPDGNFAFSNKFKLPGEVVNLISKYDPRMSKNKNRIEIKFSNDGFYSGANYVGNKDIVIIRLDKNLIDPYKTLTLVHELGHALDFLDCADKRIIPHTLPKYLQEYSAIEFTHSFIKREISKRRQKLIKYNLLSTLACTLFEIDIFTNDQQDFGKAYARAINRCYPMASQTKNPLYVFNKRFILRPLGMLIFHMVNMELYLKDVGELNEDGKKKRSV